MMKHLIFSLFAATSCVCALAQSTTTHIITPAFTALSTAQYCPALNQLTLDRSTRIWSASGGWKSYDASFTTQIGQFLGAQWIGIKIGQIACIYAGKNQYTFPILLVHNKLVKTPEGGVWKKNENDDHYHCVTHKISQCPFYPVVESENNASTTDPLIDKIQPNPVQSQINF